MMDLWKVALTSFFSVAVLFLLTKLMGNKQISQLNMFDYVTGISIGSIAAQMATEVDRNPWNAVVAMTVYAVLAFLLSYTTEKSIGWRKLVSGRPIILFDNGTFYRKNFRRARLDLSDFLALARCQGYFNMTQLRTAILEFNGAISFLPNADSRPATPADFQMKPAAETMFTDVILDGKTLETNLKRAGKDANWLIKQLKAQGYTSEKEIFLAILSESGALSAYPKVPNRRDPDPFE